MSGVVYKWKPIEDIPADLTWKGPDLVALRNAWRKHRENLKYKSAIESFNQRLAREWAIETGIIERIYSIDRGTTQLLIEKGLDASLIEHGTTDLAPNEIIEILVDHRDALEGLFDFVKHGRELTLSYIKEMHQALTRHQSKIRFKDPFGNWHDKELIRGDWKKQSNNPTRPDGTVYEYCPPEHVQSEMERLIELHQSHRDLDPIVEAAWLHHRFTQIHPFEDGNGRVARMLSSLILIQSDGYPLLVNRDQRFAYIDALERADEGKLLPLIALFSSLQSDVLRNVINL